MDGYRLHIPRIGWVRLDRGHTRYRGCRAKTVRLLKEGTDTAPEVVYAMPDTSRLDAKIRRKERKAAKARERFRQSSQTPLQPRPAHLRSTAQAAPQEETAAGEGRPPTQPPKGRHCAHRGN